MNNRGRVVEPSNIPTRIRAFGDYSIYLLGINDYLDDYLGKKVTIRENPIQLGDLWSI